MELLSFIIKAKQAGYAGSNAGNALQFEDGSKGFEIQDGGFQYIDRYCGFNPFYGTEQVFDSENSPVWIMNYYGKTLPGTDPGDTYTFLRQAMSLITPEFPFRGPPEFADKNFRYENRQNGTVKSFHGTETIFCAGVKVYELFYHGGSINPSE